jgi:hypothetical protein
VRGSGDWEEDIWWRSGSGGGEVWLAAMERQGGAVSGWSKKKIGRKKDKLTDKWVPPIMQILGKQFG